MTTVLVLYYSRNGSTAELARQIARGVESVDGATAHRGRGVDGRRGDRARSAR